VKKATLTYPDREVREKIVLPKTIFERRVADEEGYQTDGSEIESKVAGNNGPDGSEPDAADR
jgi:hypothetical protein